MIIYVDDSLEHHGIKGQQWGVRNKQSGQGKQHTSTKKKVLIGVGVGTLAVGSALAVVILKRRGGIKVSNIKPKNTVSGYKAVTALLTKNHDLKYENIKALHVSGKINTEQYTRLANLAVTQWVNAMNKAHGTVNW